MKAKNSRRPRGFAASFGRLFHRGPAGRAGGPGSAQEREERSVLLRMLEREIASAERYHEDLTTCVVGISGAQELDRPSRIAATDHLRATLDRVVRASDFVSTLGDGRFAVVLARCTTGQGRQFGERLALAAANRPVVTEECASPFTLAVNYAATQYDQHRFYGAADYLEAAEHRAPNDEVLLKQLQDGRTLRRRLIPEAGEARAA